MATGPSRPCASTSNLWTVTSPCKWRKEPLKIERGQSPIHPLSPICNMIGQKQCKKCLEWKLTTCFHTRQGSKDGLRAECKACIAEYKHQHALLIQADPERRRRRNEYQRNLMARLPRRIRKARPEYMRRYYQTHKHVYRAHNAAYEAQKRGRLVNPGACEWCAVKSAALEKHHADYSKPSEVTWLCHACHVSTRIK